LAEFSGAFLDPYDPDVHMTHVKIGRQQVFRRIVEHTNLPIDQLYKLYGGAVIGERK
jgi:hypothetical protein